MRKEFSASFPHLFSDSIRFMHDVENYVLKVNNTKPRTQKKTLETGRNLSVNVTDRRCCKLTGRLGEMYCNVCGRTVPATWVM